MRHRVRRPGQFGQIAKRLADHRFPPALPLDGKAEDARLERALAFGVIVDDLDRKWPHDGKPRPPREGNLLNRELLECGEAKRAATGLLPHTSRLGDADLLRSAPPAGQDTF